MIRTTLSYLILVLVPAVSLGIAVGPYVWAKKKSKVESRKSESNQILEDHNSPGLSYLKKGENSGRLFRSASAFAEATADRHNDVSGFVAVPLHYLWGAFFVGLVGNVGWWWIVDSIVTDRIAIFLFDTAGDGIMLGFFLLSIFIVIIPFVFYKFRHEHFTGKAIVYNIIISLLTAGLVLGVWIVLALVAYRGLFYRLN